MTLQEWIAKYQGQHVEVAGSANAINQCTDLANQYIREFLGFQIIEWTNAVDFPSKAGDKYEWIANTPTGYPLPGDIVIFKQYGKLYGEPGHIGIVVSADIKSMQVFEQNYPTGSVCKIGTHNYLGCTGWLRAKVIISIDQRLSECELHKSNLQNQVNGLLKDLEIYKGKLSDAETKVGTANGRIQELTKQNETLSNELGTVRSDNQALTRKIESDNIIIKQYNSEDAVQIRQLLEAQEGQKESNTRLSYLIYDLEESLKISHSSDAIETRIETVEVVLQSLVDSKTIIKGISDYQNIIRLGGKTLWLS